MVENKIVISKKRRGDQTSAVSPKPIGGGGILGLPVVVKKKNWKRKSQKPFKLLHFTEVCHCGQEKNPFLCVCMCAKSVFRFFFRDLPEVILGTLDKT